MDKLIDLLSSIRPDVDFWNENELIDQNIIDSFDLVYIVGELNELFDVNIGVAELLPENFNSASAMFNLIERLKMSK